MSEYLLHDIPNAELSFYNAGHLCILPTVPMVHMSSWKIANHKLMVNWSRCIEPEEKINEARECQKMYNNMLKILHTKY